MTNAYDIVTIGGGLAGASLAKVTAERGVRVLVLERETRFKDCVRGEALFPWGAAELETLGLRRLLLSKCATENRWWDDFLGHDQIGHRDTATDTPGRTATLTFYHPEMQETLLRSAAEAGAEVRRGVRATSISPGHPAKVTFDGTGRAEIVAARFVVGADGRSSLVRRWGGFAPRRDPPRLRIAGVLFEGMTSLAHDTTLMVINPELGQSSILVPQGGGRVRAYVVFPSRGDRTLRGQRDVPRFIEDAICTGVRQELFEGARSAGPLATFEGADTWVEQPYRDSVALIGDAAATSDPSWGQGLSLAVRDVRLLRDALLANDDWDRAGRTYAAGHDRGYAAIHATEDWYTTFFLETGPAADARRMRVLPLIAAEPDRMPDTFMAGPEAAPASESARRRFFGEDVPAETGRAVQPSAGAKSSWPHRLRRPDHPQPPRGTI
ncbi:NAD(P)/FAD-dependent oxidoreductase [Mesorhizobium sp.]|uniref:FAD-dependent oxidoreductase n=1 Tax=Mesorhizobium sp. TaxID=1871066 RepID=UPI000FE6564A|nr:NAD(P)/FAD-dependent oxidoreductase [Mesorhizobium sp.]RWK36217.1 MAG: FAD-dependent monooxygenase [Mesorhizobium sp.]RWK64651.1 MAG: FAD-dependent monooxygenase [Mesorhizobium sp.]RWK73323.1 MAG: FAD-dependent monooxygenase [Mesorhizobium sp.]RWK75741.1 MAG: FAD-dependent monooxygenase [Mesorhizobium sp.]RWL01238.1 MAG: FAD-dependent monooxygenase [Mesorhizobium sp.]